MARLVFLGLDGATWDILDPLLDAGKLPTFQRLVDEGTRGELQSTHPPVTFPAWRVLSSGKNPGKLGVYGWNHPDFQARDFVYPNGSDFHTRDVWDYLNQAGHTTAVVNQPGTYPPIPVDGAFISGPESQGEDIFHGVPDQLQRAYQRHTHGLANAVDRGSLPRALEVIEQNLRVAAELGQGVDVLHHVIFLTDTVQHHLWNDQAALERTWRVVDEGLEHLLDTLEPEQVFLASDHGFQALDWRVNVNQLLAEAGLATIGVPTSASLLGKLGIDRANALKLAAKLGITEKTLAKLPAFLKDRVPEGTGELHTRRAAGVTWEETVALTGDGRGVYLTDPGLADTVIDALSGALDPEGEPLFATIQPAAEVWHGDQMHLAPDLLITPRDGVEPGGSIGSPRLKPTAPGEGWIAHHHPQGIFLGWGEGIRQGEIGGARIEDVMPTLLASQGAPVPTDVDGKVLDVFTARRETATCEPLAPRGGKRVLSEAEQARVEDRLRGLGYLE
ncbi:MAG: alkaline phosphatase family protein [Candidatus Thermoplasmatota archaeon]|nr:alkaline phosphatase family protein [Candidatus Thermoplasmatota archaeon]